MAAAFETEVKVAGNVSTMTAMIGFALAPRPLPQTIDNE